MFSEDITSLIMKPNLTISLEVFQHELPIGSARRCELALSAQPVNCSRAVTQTHAPSLIQWLHTSAPEQHAVFVSHVEKLPPLPLLLTPPHPHRSLHNSHKSRLPSWGSPPPQTDVPAASAGPITGPVCVAATPRVFSWAVSLPDQCAGQTQTTRRTLQS